MPNDELEQAGSPDEINRNRISDEPDSGTSVESEASSEITYLDVAASFRQAAQELQDSIEREEVRLPSLEDDEIDELLGITDSHMISQLRNRVETLRELATGIELNRQEDVLLAQRVLTVYSNAAKARLQTAERRRDDYLESDKGIADREHYSELETTLREKEEELQLLQADGRFNHATNVLQESMHEDRADLSRYGLSRYDKNVEKESDLVDKYESSLRALRERESIADQYKG